jgi:L-ascorbate metabolism protein UlaG (beta-lactamase superfamily)
MKISLLLRGTICAASLIALGACAIPGATVGNANPGNAAQAVRFQQIRNATIKVEYSGTTFLVDPMLASKGAYPGFEGTPNSHLRNPLVDLPLPVSEVIKADAIIVTHTHSDHWDDAAKQGLPKSVPIFAQDEADAEAIRKEGFMNVRVMTENTVFNGTHLSRIHGQHGTDKMMVTAPINKLLGEASGVMFQRPGYKTVYVAGDTIWTRQVDEAIARYQPEVIILNTGYARVLGFDGSIIMGKEDFYRAYQLAPKAKVIGSHMESINHMTQTRKDLREYIVEKGMDPQRVLVPADGQSYSF